MPAPGVRDPTFDIGLPNHSSQLLEETEHFCRGRQEKVAKIVPYGPPCFFKDLLTLTDDDD
jgi:hypothetical protein